MSMQNIYDNPIFFEKYKKLRLNAQGFNDLIEQPAIRSLIKNTQNKKILDIGCGFGDFCRYLRTKGADKVVGIDPSNNMIREAKEKTNDEQIEYRCMPIETFQTNVNSFDIIVSSLVFHYIENLNNLIENIYQWLKPQGQLIFSVEHPICTAHPNATLGKDENGVFHPIYNYRDEKIFKQVWFVDGVEKYHRKISTYLNTLLSNNFLINKILEPMPTDKQITNHPHLEIHKIRPPLLIVSATRS